jgi:hypothetical protein
MLLGVFLGFLLGVLPLKSYAQGTQGGLADLQRATTGSPAGSPPASSLPSLPPPPKPPITAKTESDSPFSPKVLAEWHVEKNLCPGYLSYEELASLFPMIEAEMVQQVCSQSF